jgi:arabinose-5-phosphate isomerase
MRTLIDQQRQYLNHFFDQVDLTQIEGAAQRVFECRGTCFVSGVGKSGFIAQKIASTLVSTGTRAMFLHPLGIMEQGDVAILLSKSGETEELLSLAAQLRRKQVQLVAAVSQRQSRLARAADFTVVLPIERELCPFNLVPTTSSTVQLLFGDLLSQAVMRSKNVQLDAYAANHPGGQIGLRATLRVGELMLKGDALPIAAPELTLKEALPEFSSKRCGCLLVVDQGKLLGIFTDGDLRRSLQKYADQLLQQPMRELMNPSSRTTESNALAWHALQLMEANRQWPITVMPVVDDGQLVGLIKMHDILQAGI